MNELEQAQLEAIKPSLNELRVIREMRKLGPFGFIQITADAAGKFDSYLVHRSTKMILYNGQEPKYIKTGL